jgi:hypothetical protein
VRSPAEQHRIAREIAQAWEHQVRGLDLDEDLGTVLATAVGLMVGRMTLDPLGTSQIMTAAFQKGLGERQLQ